MNIEIIKTKFEVIWSITITTNTDTFSYDSRSQVIESENDIATTAVWNPSYTYDPIGNRLTSTGLFDSSYVTNELNQYTELSVSAPPREPVHDEDGNLIDNGTGWTYSWNAENRLVQATNGTITIDFIYDYQGRLVKKDDGTDVKVYVYDDWNRIFEISNPASQIETTKSFLWGLDLSGSMQGAGGVGGLLREGDLYPLFDANGNIMQKLDGTGSVAMSVAYDPFGNIIDGTLVGEYAFSTKPLIEHLNLYYYGFRYYDPVTGRWLNRDPIEEQGAVLIRESAITMNNLSKSLSQRLGQKIDLLNFVNGLNYGDRIIKKHIIDITNNLITSSMVGSVISNSHSKYIHEIVNLYLFIFNQSVNSYDYLGLKNISDRYEGNQYDDDCMSRCVNQMAIDVAKCKLEWLKFRPPARWCPNPFGYARCVEGSRQNLLMCSARCTGIVR